MSKRKTATPVAVASGDQPGDRRGGWGRLAIGLVVVVVSVATIWGEPRPIGDLFAALAVGRDVMDGKLGGPDDWSFTTEGRVYVNQNWGTHFVHYMAYQAGGDTGLLVAKAATLAAMALFICLAARQRGVNWPIALLVAAAAIAGGRSYIDLRANLTTLLLAPLVMWLFYMTRRSVHWIWPVVVINLVWANSHGGFIFGLGMMGLWVGVLCVERTILLLKEHKWSASAVKIAAARLWPLPTALVISVLLATFANPYGPINLLFPVSIRDPAWRELNEWMPLLAKSGFGTTWEFFLAMGIIAVMFVLRAAGVSSKSPDAQRRTADYPAVAAFELLLLAVLVYMTFTARRFVPLTIIVAAPMVGAQVQWLLAVLGLSRKTWPLVIPAVALLVPLCVHAHWLYKRYDPNNPRYPYETLFGRMHGRDVQPVKAAEFLNANNITGRVFNEWRWEGYLHWQCPQLKLFIGGRAHQVYAGATDQLNRIILSDPNMPNWRPTDLLLREKVHLAVIPGHSDRYGLLVRNLVENPEATWAYIYFDGKDVVLADTKNAYTRELIERAAAGQLKYPNDTIAALSRARTLISPVMRRPANEVLPAFIDAANKFPERSNYNCISQLAGQGAEGMQWLKEYYEREYERLSKIDINHARGLEIVACRIYIAGALVGIYHKEGNRAKAAEWNQKAQESGALAQRIMDEWP